MSDSAMTALGHSLQGRPSGKSSHVRCDAESGSLCLGSFTAGRFLRLVAELLAGPPDALVRITNAPVFACSAARLRVAHCRPKPAGGPKATRDPKGLIEEH